MYMGRSIHMYIGHRISKFENTRRLLCSGMKLFITFELNVSTERGAIFLSWLFHQHPPTRVALATKVSASKRKSTASFSVQFSTHWLFQNLPKSSARFRCVMSFALASLRFPSRAIVTSLSDMSALRTRASTYVNVASY